MAGPIAEYSIRVRNSAFQLVGELSSFQQASFTRLFNNTGTWALRLDASDPMAPYLAADGAGIQVLRILRDAQTGVAVSSKVLMSGPRWGRVRQMKNNMLIANGFDDNLWLQGRIAYPTSSTAPDYYAYVTSIGTPAAFIRCSDASGNLTDASGNLRTLTVVNTAPTYGVAPGIDDGAHTGITYADSAGYAVGQARWTGTGLPSGNNPITLFFWFKWPTGLPAAAGGYLMSFGDATVTKGGLALRSDTTTTPHSVYLDNVGQRTTASIPMVDDGVWHMYAAVYDGTNCLLYYDGVLVGQIAPTGGTMAFPATAFLGLATSASATSTVGLAGSYADLGVFASALTATQLYNLYLRGVTRFQGAAYDVNTQPVGDVLRHYVNSNLHTPAVSPLDQNRGAPATVTMGTGVGLGATVTGNARMDQLLTADGTGLLQTLAQSGGGVGFWLYQSGTGLTFDVWQPTDRSTKVIFSADLGNLADFSYQEDGPDFARGGNVVMVGGGQQGTQRIFVERMDSASIARWGRFETYLDARDTVDIPTLEQRGDAALAQMSSQTQASVVLAPQKGLVYGSDFDLGDKVTVVVDGASYSDIVRGVVIDLSRNGAETVTPMIGTPSSDVVGTFFGSYVQRKQLSQLRSTMERLSRSQ